jgi:hypothetical protein
MAAAAVVASSLKHHSAGDQMRTTGTVTLDSDYTRTGMALTAASMGMVALTDFVIVDNHGYGFSGTIAADGSKVTLLAYKAAGTAADDHTDLSGITARFIAFGY